jgi:ATP-dependent protease ClpP protease subunit
MSQNITVTNLSRRTATIDIEGIIGLDENTQFEQPRQKVATYRKLREVLEEIRNLKNPRIVINIRSAGGDVNDALLIHDALCSLEARITTRCYGYIASAATIIAQAASPGRREISSNALYLVHNSISHTEGNAEAMERTIELLQQTDRRIADIYAARSGRRAERFVELMNCNGGNGRWLSPAEAVENGLVDRIIKSGGVWERVMDRVGIRRNGKLASPLSNELTADHSSLTPDNPAKLAAGPTETTPREDPSMAEGRPSANRSAYEEDALGFKK